jgi:hypothetical protein
MKTYFIHLRYEKSIKYIQQYYVATVTVMVTYSFSTITDEAPPPPLQMTATPFCPGLRA